MQQLSNLDATFLSLESSRAPMHIGCILSFEKPSLGLMTFERFSRYIESRLSCSPIFRRRLSRLPFDLDLPYWVEDRTFKLENHLQYAELPFRKDSSYRDALINQFFAKPLNLNHPLWQAMYVESEDSNRFMVLLKFHHAAIDGVSGEKILAGLLSTSPSETSTLDDSWQGERASTALMLSNGIRSWVKTPHSLRGFALRLAESINRSRELRKRDQQQQLPGFFQSPETPFNRSVQASRQIRSAALPMSRLLAIKKASPGSTLNDVVLTVCSGALRRVLSNQDALPAKSLVAMVPVSKREGTESYQGNMISAMLVSLATQVDDPLERFKQIQQNEQKAKEYNSEVAMENVVAQLPSCSSSWTVKAYTRLRLARLLKPVFNVIVTNVPGARVPLYFDGAKMESLEGMAPIVDGMGLTFVVTSYMDTLNISVTSTQKTARFMPGIVAALEASLDELYAAVFQTATPVVHPHVASV